MQKKHDHLVRKIGMLKMQIYAYDLAKVGFQVVRDISRLNNNLGSYQSHV